MKKAFALIAVAAAFLALGFTAQPGFAVGSISGSVVDADGNGVAGAAVMVQGLMHERGHMPFMARAESGEDGSFGFADVPAGRYVVSAMKRDVGMARAEAAVQDDQETVARLVLQGHAGGGGGGGGGGDMPTGSLTGSVSDADGNAVEGATVVVMPARLVNHRGQRGHQRHMSAQTDAEGNFSFEELPAGVWVVTAVKRGVGGARDRVEIVADQEANVDLTLQGRHH